MENSSRQAVSENKLFDAITELSKKYRDTRLIAIKGRLLKIENDNLLGVIENSNYLLELNRIRVALLDLINEFEKSSEDDSEIEKKFFRDAWQLISDKNFYGYDQLINQVDTKGFTEEELLKLHAGRQLFGGNLGEALKQYLELIKKYPNSYKALSNIGYIFQQLNNINEAIKYYYRAIQTGSNDKLAFYNLYYLYGSIGRETDSLSLCNEMLLISPNEADYYFYKALLFSKKALDDYYVGKQNFDKAISLEPANANYYYQYSIFETGFGVIEEALRRINEAIKITPNAFYFSYKGALYHDRKDYHYAVENYSKAILLEPNNLSFQKSRAYAYLDLKMFQECIDDCDRVLEIEPKDHEIFWILHWVYFNNNDYIAARKNIEMAIASYDLPKYRDRLHFLHNLINFYGIK